MLGNHKAVRTKGGAHVGHLQLPGARQHQVLEGDISVGDVKAVEVGQAHGRLAQEAQGLCGLQEPVPDARSPDHVPQGRITQL
eukprot:10270676-Lingulodinium_polyedra.AAC.1